MEQWTNVRRAVLVEGISKREACRRFGIHWDTLKRILEHSSPPGYQRIAKADRPVVGPWLDRLRELLESNTQPAPQTAIHGQEDAGGHLRGGLSRRVHDG